MLETLTMLNDLATRHHLPIVFFPNQACLWGPYFLQKISLGLGRRGTGSPVTAQMVPPAPCPHFPRLLIDCKLRP